MTWTTRPTFLVAVPAGFFSVAIAVAITGFLVGAGLRDRRNGGTAERR
jgi:hypothetical protein